MELGCGQNVYFGGRGIPTKVDLTCHPQKKAFNRRVRKEKPQRTPSKSLSCSSQRGGLSLRARRLFFANSAVKSFLSVLASSAPPGLGHFRQSSTACAVGCILSPLRGLSVVYSSHLRGLPCTGGSGSFLRERGCQTRCQELIGEIPNGNNRDRCRAFHFAGASKADADEHERPDADHV